MSLEKNRKKIYLEKPEKITLVQFFLYKRK